MSKENYVITKFAMLLCRLKE